MPVHYFCGKGRQYEKFAALRRGVNRAQSGDI